MKKTKKCSVELLTRMARYSSLRTFAYIHDLHRNTVYFMPITEDATKAFHTVLVITNRHLRLH